MILKRLVLVAGVIVMLTGIIIFVQENIKPAMDGVEDIETLAMTALSECSTLSSNVPQYSLCFNEKINLLESKFPSIRTDLKKMGFVLEDYSSEVMKFSNMSDNQQW